MTFGVCCGLANVEAVRAAGFEHVELPAAALLENLGAFRAAKPISTNVFFPGSIRLFGDEATDWRPYVQELLPAAASCGIRVMVVGSAGSRRAPEGWSEEDGNHAFAAVIAEAQALAVPYGITLAPEALNRTEANLGTRLRPFALALGARGVAYCADAYHSLKEAEFEGRSVDWEHEMPHRPAHVHLANVHRTGISGDDPALQGFFTRLRELGFDGHVSVESGHTGDYASALRLWRSALETLAA